MSTAKQQSEVAPDPSRAEGVCRVAMFYDDTAARDRAVTLSHHLVDHFWHELDFAFSWWRFRYLADPVVAETASVAAAISALAAWIVRGVYDELMMYGGRFHVINGTQIIEGGKVMLKTSSPIRSVMLVGLASLLGFYAITIPALGASAQIVDSDGHSHQGPLQSGFIDVNEGKLYYEAAGQGEESIVFIHDGLVQQPIAEGDHILHQNVGQCGGPLAQVRHHGRDGPGGFLQHGLQQPVYLLGVLILAWDPLAGLQLGGIYLEAQIDLSGGDLCMSDHLCHWISRLNRVDLLDQGHHLPESLYKLA